MTYLTPLLTPIRPAKLRLSIRRIESRMDKRRFVGFPRQLYRGDPYWTPASARGQAKLLDRGRNPTLAEAGMAMFLAEDHGSLEERVVGTVVALISPRYNDLCGEAIGLFSLFEVINNQEVATALLEAVEEWVLEQLPGAAALRGPVALSPVHAAGILADGFNVSPAPLMPYHPPYYAEMLEMAGFEPVEEWLGHQVDLTAHEDWEPGHADVERTPKGAGLILRALTKQDLTPTQSHLRPLIETAWEPTWCNTPPNEAEVDYILTTLTAWADPELCCVAEQDGRPIALCLSLAEARPAVRYLAGAIRPAGRLLHWLVKRQGICARILPPCFLPGHRDPRSEALIYRKMLSALARAGYRRVEISPLSPADAAAAEVLQSLGARIVRRYRGYEKPLGAGAPIGSDDGFW